MNEKTIGEQIFGFVMLGAFVLMFLMTLAILILVIIDVRIRKEIRDLLVVVREWVGFIKEHKSAESSRASRGEMKTDQLTHAVLGVAQSIQQQKTTEGSNDLPPSENLQLCTIQADVNGKILFVSPRAAHTFGYEVYELVGQNVRVLIPDRYHEKHEAGLEKMRRNEAGSWTIKTIVGFGRCKDGTEKPVSISLTWYKDPDDKLVITATVGGCN